MQTTAPHPEAADQVLGELHYHRLLVAIDGSESSTLALGAAVTVARRDHASLTLLCVVPDMIAEAARWPWPPSSPQLMQDDADAAGEKALRAAVERIPEDISVTTLIRHGKAGQEIVAEASEADYDAIMVGARGVGRVGSLIGSVSQHVLRHAPAAVFVAHAPRP
jgi:nucleotide-binding universal stress UspA family protein